MSRRQVALVGMALALAAKAKGQKASGEQELRSALRAAVRAYWSGATTEGQFQGQFGGALERRLRQAWLEGLDACGFTEEELTPAERRVFDGILDEQLGYVTAFGEDILGGDRESGGKLEPLYSRVELWAGAYGRTKAQAQAIACGDQKLKWVWNPLKEHCGDCAKMNGRVYRASTWAAYGVLPRSRDLECGGWRCGCRFEPTSAPLTSGRPPALAGG